MQHAPGLTERSCISYVVVFSSALPSVPSSPISMWIMLWLTVFKKACQIGNWGALMTEKSILPSHTRQVVCTGCFWFYMVSVQSVVIFTIFGLSPSVEKFPHV